MIVSARADKDVVPAYLDRWLREDAAGAYTRKHRIHLEKLSSAEVDQLVRELFDKAQVSVPNGLARSIYKASEQGYALFARIMTETAIADVQKGQKIDLRKAPKSLRGYAESEFRRLGKLPDWRVHKPLLPC